MFINIFKAKRKLGFIKWTTTWKCQWLSLTFRPLLQSQLSRALANQTFKEETGTVICWIFNSLIQSIILNYYPETKETKETHEDKHLSLKICEEKETEVKEKSKQDSDYGSQNDDFSEDFFQFTGSKKFVENPNKYSDSSESKWEQIKENSLINKTEVA